MFCDPFKHPLKSIGTAVGGALVTLSIIGYLCMFKQMQEDLKPPPIEMGSEWRRPMDDPWKGPVYIVTGIHDGWIRVHENQEYYSKLFTYTKTVKAGDFHSLFIKHTPPPKTRKAPHAQTN